MSEVNEEKIVLEKAYAYTDGSYNSKKKESGYGAFLVYKGEKLVVQGKGIDKDLVSMRNVYGEILAVQKIVELAITLGIEEIDIYFDYLGVSKWANGEWKRNKEGTKNYHKFIKESEKKIKITWHHVKGHDGELGNEEADRLAGEACGVKEKRNFSGIILYNNMNKEIKRFPEELDPKVIRNNIEDDFVITTKNGDNMVNMEPYSISDYYFWKVKK